jgi:carbon monoxide dehydrogenase subunit G
MKITNEFTVHTPIERAWALLTDLEGIAPCLPGAQLTGVDGDTYSGRVKVKVGPVVSDFAGTARFIAKDDEARRAVIDAKGRDSRSAGNAAAVVTAQLRADGDRTLVNVDTDLKISGKLAQFGSGMIKEVSGKLLGQFVTNLEAKLAAEPAAAEPAVTGSGAAGSSAAGSGAAESSAGLAAAAAPEDNAADTPTLGSQATLGTQGAHSSQRAQAVPATQESPSGPADKGGTSAAAIAGPAAADSAQGATKAGPTPPPAGSGPTMDSDTETGSGGGTGSGKGTGSGDGTGSGKGTGSDEGTDSDAAVFPASLNGTTVRILPGQHAPLPAAAPLSSESGGAEVVEEAGATAKGDGEPARVPDRFSAGDEPEALDLLALAGGSVYKRVIPLGIGAAVVAAVVVWFVARR